MRALTLTFAALILTAGPVLAGSRVAVLHGTSPPVLSIVDLSSASVVELADGRAATRLPVPTADSPRALAASSAAGRVWIATSSRLMRLGAETREIERSLELRDLEVGHAIDMGVWSQDGRELVALLVAPPQTESFPQVVVFDGETGQRLTRFENYNQNMREAWALHAEPGSLVIYNRRAFPLGGESPALTRLIWQDGDLHEVHSMYLGSPGALRRQALVPVRPDHLVCISTASDTILPVELDARWSPQHWDAEGALERWGCHPDIDRFDSPVAAAADPDYAGEHGEPHVFVLDQGTAELIALDGVGRIGERGRWDLTESGLLPELGSDLVISAAASTGAMSSPASSELYLFDLDTLAPKKVVKLPSGAPFALIRIP